MTASRFNFRAWDAINKKMVSCLPLANYAGSFADEYDPGVTHFCEPWMCMQSTGLVDKNGTEIFEGDICQMFKEKDNPTAVVRFGVYGDLECAFDEEHIGFFFELGMGRFTLPDHVEHCIVIGNIHANPKLLKG